MYNFKFQDNQEMRHNVQSFPLPASDQDSDLEDTPIRKPKKKMPRRVPVLISPRRLLFDSNIESDGSSTGLSSDEE